MDLDIYRISQVIKDYGLGKFGKLDSVHVRRWLDQFDDNHSVIAHETANILEKYYIGESDFKRFSEALPVRLKTDFGENFTIMKAQEASKSQAFLINMVENNNNNIFKNKSLITRNLLYIDDFIFSGQTLVSDFKRWFDLNPNIRNATVHIITIAKYNYNTDSTLRFLEYRYKEKNIKFQSIAFAKYKMTDTFQLSSSSLSDSTVSNYIHVNPTNSPKPRVRAGNLINNISNRDLYEVEMVKAGIKIIGFCEKPRSVMRPFGFGGYGLGFGGALFSYRKCPNTTPLAFWWGNPNYHIQSHPFRKWYPLMQRSD